MITIRDVAREAGVSASTVSAVLGNRAGRLGIKAATCEKVVRAAAKLRYRRNDIAAQMKSGRRSSMLFLLSESVDNILFGGLAAACAEAENAGYFPKLLRVETENHEELHRRLELVLRQCPAAILCWGDRSGDETYLRRVTEECSIPFVHFDYVSRSSRAYVRTDDPSGIRSGVEHLHMLGHRRFAHITDIMKAQYAEIRLRDYREALAEFGLELPENRVLSLGLNAPESGVRTFLERMRGEGVTAITCGSDRAAEGRRSSAGGDVDSRLRRPRLCVQLLSAAVDDPPAAGGAWSLRGADGVPDDPGRAGDGAGAAAFGTRPARVCRAENEIGERPERIAHARRVRRFTRKHI